MTWYNAKYPPMKHDDQFTERELTTRRIASLRIHVERAIGEIKKIKSLMIFQIICLGITDQIFFVCAMLCMFDPPLRSK